MMKLTRRITALALALLMLTALAACGSSSDDPASPSDEVIGDVASSAAPSESPEASEEPEESDEPTPTPTPVPTPTPTPAPTPTPVPSVQPTEQPVAPSETPDAQPSENPDSESIDLSAFYDTVTSSYEFASLSDLDSTMLDTYYPGLTAVSTLQLIAKMPMISARIPTTWRLFRPYLRHASRLRSMAAPGILRRLPSGSLPKFVSPAII